MSTFCKQTNPHLISKRHWQEISSYVSSALRTTGISGVEAEERAAETGHSRERCLCYEVLDMFRARIGVSPQVRQHLTNSRIEFLKAIREVIDERIEHLAKPAAQQGTKIPIEQARSTPRSTKI